MWVPGIRKNIIGGLMNDGTLRMDAVLHTGSSAGDGIGYFNNAGQWNNWEYQPAV